MLNFGHTVVMKKTTLKDIAEAAGVSVATVSMILSGKGKISEAVSTRVQNIASEMNYIKYSKEKSETKGDFKYVAIIQRELVSYLWNFSIPFTLLLEDVVQQKGQLRREDFAALWLVIFVEDISIFIFYSQDRNWIEGAKAQSLF